MSVARWRVAEAVARRIEVWGDSWTDWASVFYL